MFANQWNRSVATLLALTLLATSVLPMLAQDNAPAAAATGKGPLVVSSKEDTEGIILGQMFALLLQNNGYQVEDKTGLGGSPAVRAALENGEIDLYPEFTGTAVSLYHNLPASALPSDPERVYVLAKSLDAEKGFTWLKRINFNDTYALMVRQDLANQGITSIQELADYMNANDSPLKICVESEWYSRQQDGLKGLEDRYGFAFNQDNILFMDLNQTYESLRDNKCDVAEGYSTDGRGTAWGFVNLVDNLGFFPSYYPAPVVRSEILDQYPDLVTILDPLADALNETTMSQLNARANIGADGLFGSGDEESPKDVALSFLQSARLITPPTIKISSKDFTEQLLLGKMMVLLLQDAGYEVEDKTGLGGSPAVRAALESGEIDIYPEYTGTALSLHNGLPASALPTDPDRAWELARSLDARKDLVWLDRAKLNDTYTLMVRQDLVDKGIRTLEDLARYMNENDSPLSVCIESEFYGRELDGIKGLEQRYGFKFKQEKVQFMEIEETYPGLRDGQCDISEGFSTDGRIDAWGFYNLKDTLNFFPIYNPAPVVRKEVLDRSPEIADLINRLAPLLDDAVMARLNARVDLGEDGVSASGDEESVENVAYSFLRSQRLLKPPKISVGAEQYTEQALWGAMLRLLLQNDGYEVIDNTGIGATKALRKAMEDGAVDVYVEYTGQALTVHHELPSDALPTTPTRVWALARTMDARKGIVWLEPGLMNDTYAFMVRNNLWEEQQIRTLEDLARYMNENDSPLKICIESDFFARQYDGFPAIQATYGFAFKEENVLLSDLDGIYEALRNEECDIGEGYTTDGRGAAYGFHNLEDTLNVFPIYSPGVVIRKEVLEANPELKDLLGGFVKLLDNDSMSRLNSRVDLGEDGVVASGDEEVPLDVARDFLLQAGLIDEANQTSAPAPSAGSAATAEPAATDAAQPELPTEPITATEGITIAPSVAITANTALTGTLPVSPTGSSSIAPATTEPTTATPIVVGSATANEDQLLGHMLVLLLEEAGQQVQNQTAFGEPPDVRAALDKGQLDLYPEFTGRALATFHDLSVSALPTDADRSYALATSLDQPQGIIWLNRGFFNHTPAVLTQGELAEQGIQQISDLAPLLAQDPAALKLCVDQIFAVQQANGLAALQARYDLPFQPENVLIMEPAAVYPALRDRECTVAIGMGTAGEIIAWGFQVLADDLNFFPSNIPTAVARQVLLEQKPEIEALLSPLGPVLDDNSIRLLNALVGLGPDAEADTDDEFTPQAAAQFFLCQQSLIQACDEVDATLELSFAIPPAATPLTAPAELSATSDITVALDISPTATLSVSVTDALTDSPVSEPVTRVIVSTPATHGVNARNEPNITAAVLQLLPSNTLVPAIGRSSDSSWLLIILPNGEEAWVFAEAMLYRPEATEQLPVAP